MRLLECDVENFGRLSDFHLSFADGLTTLCCENGWGKSTLAAFIRIMFYGFEGEKRRKNLNERNYYRPWQGGVYGGQVTFETGGKSYRMARVFGKKEAEDVFELRDAKTNLESGDYSSNIGRELFEIDSESFMRTVFIGQNDCATRATGDINARMGNIADHTEDLTDYDAADQSLTNLRNSMSPRRKTGDLYKIRERVTTLEQQVREEETLDQAMRRLQMEISKQKQDLEKIQEEQKSVSDRQKKASAQKEAQALRERYKEIVQRTQEAEKSLKEARSAFPKEVPTAQEMAALSESCAKMTEARTAAQTLELGETEKEKLQRLDTLFASGIPDKSEIKRLRQQIQNLDFLRREEDKNRLGESEAEELASYRQRFAGTQKATEALEDLQDLWSERSNRNAAFQALEESAKQRRAEKELVGKRHQVRMQAILAAGIVLTASGILLGVLKDFSLLSWLVLLIGALAAVAAVAGIAASGSADRQEIQATGKMDFESEQIQRIDQRISQTLQEMGLDYLPETFPETFHKLNREAIRYEDLLAKEKRAGQQSHGKEAQELSRQLQCFFAAYGRRVSEEDFGEKLHVLEADIGEIQGLQAKKHAQWNQKKRYREKREEAELLLRKLGYDATENVPALTAKIQEQLQLYQQRERILRTEQERKEQFEKASENRSLLKEPEKKPENLEELDERYQDLADRAENIRELLREYREQMRDFREKSDELALVGEELNELRKRQKSDLRKYELLGKTQEYLSQAKEALTARYIIPLKERYSLYYEKIADLSAEAFHLDANAQVTVEEKGMLRETQSLSAGFQDMVGLCLRLAFADVMYKDEKPPLILDDPFVNLDQDKLKGGKALLDELTEKYQILYLTCNESRK